MFTNKPLLRFITLGQFIIERQTDFPFAKGELSRLLRDIGIASKLVNREVNKAGLADILGDMGETNVQGEDQKSLMFMRMSSLLMRFVQVENVWPLPRKKTKI